MMCWQTQSAEERKLLEDFDKDLYINPDGSFKTTQLRGIDSIYTPQDRPQYKVTDKKVYADFFLA